MHDLLLQLLIEFVIFAETTICIGQRRVDLAMIVHALERRSLRLHIQRMVEVIVDTQFLVYFCSSFAMVPREHRCFMFVKCDHVFLLNREISTHIVGYHLRLCQKVLSFDAPANLTWDARRLILHTWLLID